MCHLRFLKGSWALGSTRCSSQLLATILSMRPSPMERAGRQRSQHNRSGMPGRCGTYHAWAGRLCAELGQRRDVQKPSWWKRKVYFLLPRLCNQSDHYNREISLYYQCPEALSNALIGVYQCRSCVEGEHPGDSYHSPLIDPLHDSISSYFTEFTGQKSAPFCFQAFLKEKEKNRTGCPPRLEDSPQNILIKK